MSSFYADPAVGGDGSTTTDDNNATTGLGNGGFWTRLLPMFVNIVAIANYVRNTLVVNAAASATAAANSATSAANAPGTSATTTTPMTIGIQTATCTLAQTGKLFSVGQTVVVASTASPQNWMSGIILSFAGQTLQVQYTNFGGSGSFSAWTVSLSGPAGVSGVLNELKGTPIASAATVNLDSATGNLVHITGTTGITAFTLAAGSRRVVIFDGVLTLTNSANLILPGGANVTTAAGDMATVYGDGSGVVYVTDYIKKSGLPNVNPPVLQPGLMCLSAVDASAGAASVTFNMDATYDEYVLEIAGAVPTADASAAQLGFSTDGGSTFSTNMAYTTSLLDGSTTAGGTNNASASALPVHYQGTRSTSGVANSGGVSSTIRIYNPASTTKRKGVQLNSAQDNGTTPLVNITTATLATASAVNAVRFTFQATTIASGSFRFYGIRKVLN